MTNVEVVRRMYRAFADGDYDTFRALTDPDLVWIQNAGFPNGRRHTGADAVVKNVFEGFGTDWKNWRFDAENYLESENAVVVIGTYTGQHRVTGKTFNAAAAHVYDLRNGKIHRFRQFADTKLIADAMT